MTDYSEKFVNLKGNRSLLYLTLENQSGLASSKLSKLKELEIIDDSDLDLISSNLTLTEEELLLVNNAKTSVSELSTEPENDIFFRFVLSTLTGLKNLSVRGVGNLTSLDFINTNTSYEELDTRLCDRLDQEDYTLLTNLPEIRSLGVGAIEFRGKEIILTRLFTNYQATSGKPSSSGYNKSVFTGNAWSVVTTGLWLFGENEGKVFEGCSSFKGLSLVSTTGFVDLSTCSGLRELRLFGGSALLPKSDMDLLYLRSGQIKNTITTVLESGVGNEIVLNHSIDTLHLQEATEARVKNWLSNLKETSIKTIDASGAFLGLTEVATLLGSYGTLEKITSYETSGKFYASLGQVCVGQLKDLKNFTNLKHVRACDAFNVDFFEGLDQEECSNLSSIEFLDVRYQGIVSISGIEILTNLETLYLEDNYVSDLKPLMNLKKLKVVNLKNNSVEDLYPLNNLIGINEGNVTVLKILQLDNNLLQKYSDDYSIDVYIEKIPGEHKRGNLETIESLIAAGVNVTYSGNNL